MKTNGLSELISRAVPRTCPLGNTASAALALFAAAIFAVALGMHDVAPAAADDTGAIESDQSDGDHVGPEADQARDETEPAETPLHRPDDPFELRVVGPDGRPVPEATVEIRTRPAPTAEQVRVGTFSHQGNYGSFIKTDEQGRLVAELGESFSLSIEEPGFGPYWAGWDGRAHPESIPSKFTAELEGAWSVGGVVVDESGEPVAGATVRPDLHFKMRPGDHGTLGIGTRLTTDADGKWTYESVPEALSDVRVEISHPDFMSHRPALARSGFAVEPGKQPKAKIVLDAGLTVTGTVTDAAGQPIAGALIRTKFLNDLREAITDTDGKYQLQGCEPRMTRIVASANGRAMELQTVRVEPNMEPVDFQLQPGGTIRVRVLDENGAPIPKTRIFFQRWHGAIDYFEFDHVHSYTGENGVWEWNEAPLEEIQADISAPGRMQLSKQTLKAGEVPEYVFIPPPPLVIHGNVFDAETGEPIKKFRAIPGVRSTPEHMNWVHHEVHQVTDGEYRLRRTYGYLAHVVRIEADGYLAAVSREIASDEGDVRLDFRLHRGQNVAATVLTPDGVPAAGASIALGVAGSQISIENGAIDDGSTYAAQLETDDSGRFSFPPQSDPFQLVITHPSGFAHFKSADGPIPDPLTLTPWARVEGTFRVGSQTIANAPLTLSGIGIHSYGDDVPNIFTHHYTTTGPDGRFVFDRAFPGEGRLGRRILLMVDDGATEVTSSKMEPVTLTAGETLAVDLGGNGRPVTGKLAPANHHDGKVFWNFAIMHVQPDLPPAPDIPADAPDAAELRTAWREALDRLRSTTPRFTVSIDRDGSFRIDDVPAGKYKLRVRFTQRAAGQLVNYQFDVPPIEEGRHDRPFDLGTLTLE